MKKIRNNRGITLVALIVTIIILLILAGISIASLTGNGLFEKAKLAKEKQENAEIEEEATLSDYETEIENYLNNSREENNNINEFTPRVDKVKTYELEIYAETSSKDSNIVCYVYLLNGIFKGVTTVNSIIIDNLNADTEYEILVIAINSNGNTKKSNKIKQKTKSEIVFSKEYLESGEISGNVSIVDSLYNGKSGLSITGICNVPSGKYSGLSSNPLRWYKNIDLTKFNTLEVYIKKGANHGCTYIYVDDTEMLNKDYRELSSEWTKYNIDLNYVGEHTLSFVGGYPDCTGSTGSNTQYSEIKLYYK